MLSISFYLLGEDPTNARLIDIEENTDYEGFQNVVASHFAIVHPSGECLSTTSSVNHLMTF